MKKIVFSGIIVLMIWAFSPSSVAAQASASIEPSLQDSTQYEVLIIDPHFDQWYLKNFHVGNDRSDEYYHSKNLFAVANWNSYYNKGEYSFVIDSYIDYQHQIDYGIEVNRKLFWYFKYVEDSYEIKLF